MARVFVDGTSDDEPIEKPIAVDGAALEELIDMHKRSRRTQVEMERTLLSKNPGRYEEEFVDMTAKETLVAVVTARAEDPVGDAARALEKKLNEWLESHGIKRPEYANRCMRAGLAAGHYGMSRGWPVSALDTILSTKACRIIGCKGKAIVTVRDMLRSQDVNCPTCKSLIAVCLGGLCLGGTATWRLLPKRKAKTVDHEVKGRSSRKRKVAGGEGGEGGEGEQDKRRDEEGEGLPDLHSDDYYHHPHFHCGEDNQDVDEDGEDYIYHRWAGHCDKCPGLGSCLVDYRNAHCELCHDHFFTGHSGFACICKHRERMYTRARLGDRHSLLQTQAEMLYETSNIRYALGPLAATLRDVVPELNIDKWNPE